MQKMMTQKDIASHERFVRADDKPAARRRAEREAHDMFGDEVVVKRAHVREAVGVTVNPAPDATLVIGEKTFVFAQPGNPGLEVLGG